MVVQEAEVGKRRAEHNAAQFINTLGLVAPLGANGEIDMPAEVGERASGSCYKPERKCQDKASCTERTAQSARKLRYNQARRDVNCTVKQNVFHLIWHVLRPNGILI